MKKLLRKRSMLLVALLVSLCMPAMADTAEKTFASGDGTSGQVGGNIISYEAVKGDYDPWYGDDTPQVARNSAGDRAYALRIYGGSTSSNKLYIRAADGYLISNVEIDWYRYSSTYNYNGGSPSATATKDGVSVGRANVTTSGTTLTMSVNPADEVTISVTDELRILTITVTYAKETIVDPDIPGTDPEIGDLDPTGETVYYIRNKATGLYIKYGGSWGMDAIEGRAAHPFKLTKNTDGSYALASIHGYFNSNYSFNSLFMDRPQSESTWSIVEVESGDEVYYYLRGENGYALASVGNQYGILEFRKHDTGDIFQRWEFVTIEETLPAEMAKASVTTPVDVTPFIKGAAFDFADHVEVQEGDPFYNEITGLTDENWTYQHSYANNWVGFKVMEQYDWMSRWSDEVGVSNTNLNGIGLSRNNIHDRYVVEQYLGELPAGTYTFTYQGFYNVRNIWGEINVEEIEKPTIAIATAVGDVDPTNKAEVAFVNYTDNTINNLMDNGGGGDDRGYYVATLLRDNRDLCRNSIQFTLNETTHVLIRITKPETDETWGGSKLQWIIAFDDFTLMYQGTGNATVVDQAVLYYDRVKEAYEYYSKKVSELGVPASYETCDLDGCVHWTAWDNAINGVVSVNGLNLRGNQYTVPSQKFAYLNGEADINKIDTEEEFLEALAMIEDAYQAAYKEHNSHKTDRTEKIGNPSFEVMEGYAYADNKVSIPSWNNVMCTWDGSAGINYWSQCPDVVRDANGLSHELKYAHSVNIMGEKDAHPILQSITIEEAGLYELSALVASCAKGEVVYSAGEEFNNGEKAASDKIAQTDYTVFLTAGTYHSGVVPKGKDNFIEHKLLFLVEQDNTTINIGALGGDGADFNLYDPRGGGFFRVDNFALNYVSDVPNGRVKLAIDEVKKIELDEYGKQLLYLADYEALFEGGLVTDADAVVQQIYSDMKEASLAQKTKNADMTWAIENANFELGETGWNFTETPENWETGVFPHDKAKASIGADGGYLFNTWSADGANCKEITQTISGLRNGTYCLSAMVASDNGNKMTIKAGESAGEVTCIGANDMVEVSCEFTVTGGPEQKITIGVYNNSTWYKADNFRLTFLHNKLALDHEVDPGENINDWYTDVNLTRNIPVGKWQPFLVPYTMAIPANWDVREFIGIELDETGVHLKLLFSEKGQVTSIEAGKPYMIRNDGEAAVPVVAIEYADVVTASSTLKPQTMSLTENFTGNVVFQGNYGKTTIPQGAYYISSNKFYIASRDIEMKGYRAFFNPDDFVKAKVRSLGMGSRTETFIDSIELEDEVVIGIYDVNGIRLSEMKPGINILHMNNGTTKKVIVK